MSGATIVRSILTLSLTAALVAACSSGPHLDGQSSVQQVEGRVLSVRLVEGYGVPQPIDVISVSDEAGRLTANDRALAAEAYARHCQALAAAPAVGGVYREETREWVFPFCAI